MKPIYVNDEQYSYILFEQVRLSCSSFSDLCKEINISNDLVNYLTYYQYILYISANILLKRYDRQKIDNYIDLVWENLFSYIKETKILAENKTDDFKDVFKKAYKELENKKIKIDNDDSLHNLAEEFLKEIECDNDSISHLNVFLAFSGFIIYHSESLLNESVIVQ